MKILILGGTAFLSAATARLALARGHQVTCLARGSNRRPQDGVRWVRADRDTGAEAYAGLAGERFDAVIDVATQPAHVRDAVAALAARSAHWTLVSTLSVYADDGTPGADESADTHPPLPGDRFTEMTDYGSAKVACERIVQEALAGRAHLCRAGLISGPGDPSDRFGYWPARFARDPADTVLVPDAPAMSVQVIDVDDLAGWLVDAAEAGVTGVLNATGDATSFDQVLRVSARVAGHHGRRVAVDPQFLLDHGVQYWAGPDSLPLWVPPDHAGFGDRSNSAAKSAGMLLRPLDNVVARALAYERHLGPDRERRAGLDPVTEARILQAWSAQAG